MEGGKKIKPRWTSRKRGQLVNNRGGEIYKIRFECHLRDLNQSLKEEGGESAISGREGPLGSNLVTGGEERKTLKTPLRGCSGSRKNHKRVPI